MESDKQLNELLSKPDANKKEEIAKFEHLINNFNSDQPTLDRIYIDIFNNIIEKRLNLISVPEPDYMYIWKAFQTIRVLSRNKTIQNEMYKESHLSIYQSTLLQLTNIYPKSKIVENIIIELLTIIQRYIYSETEQEKILKEKYISFIIESDIFDNMILLLSQENEILLKLLKSLFKILSLNEKMTQKISEPLTIKTLLNILAYKNNDGRPFSSVSSNIEKKNIPPLSISVVLDICVMLSKNEKFMHNFILLKGYLNIFNIIKSNRDYESYKENIIKGLYIIQVVVKIMENRIYDLKSFINLFEYLMNNKITEEDNKTGKLILNTFSIFALNNELIIVINPKWAEVSFRLFLLYALKIKDLKDNQDKKEIISNQNIIIRVLRLIYSFERNRDYFIQIIPQNLLKLFINIPNNNRDQSLSEHFINGINDLSNDELENILNKIKNIFEYDENNKEINGYKICEILGNGGFGPVYKVISLSNKKEYAMKRIKLEQKQILYYTEHPNEMEKKINEISIWKLFDHPNIIKYYNCFIYKGNCYIIMELVNGLSLGEYLTYLKENNISLKSELIIKIILQIVNGLKHIHKVSNVIYRDLNPNNIILDNYFNVKLIDFGLAMKNDINNNSQISNLLNQSTELIFEGNILYSPPEIMKNETIVFESDIWALGCIVYEMIKLQPPFCGDTPLTIAKNACEENYEKLNDNDCKNDDIIELVNKCLVADYKKRINIDEVCQIMGPFLFDYLAKVRSRETQLQKEILEIL